MSISLLVLELWQFSFIRDWPETQKSEIPPSEFCPISGDWAEWRIPNLNVAKCQGYNFCSQAVIILIEKKERDKRFIKKRRPISLLNVNYEIVAKALVTRLKETLPKLISSQQTAYVKNRFIGEGGRLISNILEMSEKAFDSLRHSFLLACLKK